MEGAGRNALQVDLLFYSTVVSVSWFVRSYSCIHYTILEGMDAGRGGDGGSPRLHVMMMTGGPVPTRGPVPHAEGVP